MVRYYSEVWSSETTVASNINSVVRNPVNTGDHIK